MDVNEAGRYWEENAEVWTRLARAGFDLYRDRLNTPAFFEALPDVTGRTGLDIGCGEGYNTRLLARRGARMTGIDIAPGFLSAAADLEQSEPLGIQYRLASMTKLPFESERFDFATAFMSMMDNPEPETALAEAFRVIRPGGFLQFSISHPCFNPPHRVNLRGADGRTRAIEVGSYFKRGTGEVSTWIFGAAPLSERLGSRKFRTPDFHRPLADWVSMILATGFRIEMMAEPTPDEQTVRECPYVEDATVVAYFLHFRVAKPLGS